MVLLLITVCKKVAMKFINLFFYSLFLVACANTKQTFSNSNENMIQNSIAILDDALYQKPQAAIEIDSIALVGNVLTINYRSCNPNTEIQLIGSTAIAKSFPPIRRCKLIETKATNNKGQSILNFPHQLQCNIQILSTKRSIDAPTYLEIEGWSEKILYLYTD